jgi:prepilin-type N-terminal cleavage/methylation domain-containing protein
MKNKGFTLIELLITTFIGSLIIIFCVNYFKSYLWNYSQQKQITEMNANVQYAIHKIPDLLYAAGANLPTKNNAIINNLIIIDDASSIYLRSNPNGGKYVFLASITSNTIHVSNAKGFIDADSLLIAPLNSSYSLTGIDTTYSVSPYYKGINVDSNKIRLTLSTNYFGVGDTIYAFKNYHIYKNGMNLCIGNASDIVAENIDSLYMKFYDNKNIMTTDWLNMKFGYVCVRAKTAIRDPKYKIYPDGCRRLILSSDVCLRNK